MKRLVAVMSVVLGITACLNPVDQGPARAALFSHASGATWTPIAGMANARYAAMAASGLDGLIYVFGGLNGATYDPASEAYDPATDTWSTIAQSDRRFLAGVARGGDGRIYLAGGDDFAQIFSTVVAYDPGTDTYAPVAPMSGPRDGPAAAAGQDGRVYVIGGYFGNALTSGEVYDPSNGTWSPIAPTAVPHYAGAAVAGPDGKIYVFGGYDGSFVPSASAEAYDPATNLWASVASLPAPRFGHAALAGADGHLYIVGGQDNRGAYLSSVVAYEPATDTWTTVAPLNVARFLLAGATGPDGRLYAIGGHDGIGFLSSAESYDTQGAANRAPTADAGADQVAECVSGGANVTLDGSGSLDPDDGIASYEWTADGVVIATGANPTVHCALGSTTLTLRVTDHGGLTGTDDVVITVQDARAPAVNLTLLAAELWPPNHTMRQVASRIWAADDCDGAPALAVTVTSNEPVEASDWEVVPNGDGTFAVWVRAERSGGGNGRVYVITATATDHAGNTGQASATVTVPH